MKNLLDAIKDRRSIYAIGKGSPISDDRIVELVAAAVKNVPSAYNMQDQKAVLLLGADNDKFWSIVMETLRKIVPAGSFAKTEAKIKSFASGHGTVLYFADMDVVEGMAKDFPLYADKFHTWYGQGAGMLQYAIWTLLESEGLGATLQHYNPLVDAEVKATWKLPDSWQLLAEMPFGIPTGKPDKKEFDPIDARLKIFGK